MERISSIEKLDTLRDKLLLKQGAVTRCLTLCGGTGCRAYGCMEVVEAFKKELKKRGLTRKVAVKTTGCHGFCERGPMVLVSPEGIFYEQISTKDVPEIVEKTLLENEVVDRLVYKDPNTGKPVLKESDIPFYRLQNRFLLGENLVIDPTSIDDYITQGGYKALWKALTQLSPEQIIEEVKLSGLRGRGGGGFPTGRKWESCRKAEDLIKYVICNADEGDPGAFMDRSLLEGDPHSVLEGMTICAWAVGASRGTVYVRAEYPLAVEKAREAIARAEEAGLLGENILASGFDFHLEVFQAAGAFVCGEETALMASIEGRRGMPRIRPPFPADRGLHGKPTVINNVKTFASVQRILGQGWEAFARLGSGSTRGTTVFALAGKVQNTGLVEVPMGTPLRQLVFEIGGGIPEGKLFKAVQIGGPSGGCLPESLLDTPIGFKALREAGAMMGSGGMVVLDEDNCMVETARFFLDFTQKESCGKCTFCRLGTQQMLVILEDICRGEGSMEQLDLLASLAEDIRLGSLCNLGKTAPNPILTTIRHFRDEYEAHILEKKCPAKVCTALMSYYILPDKCERSCDACVGSCPTEAIWVNAKRIKVIDQALCIQCGACLDACPPQYKAVVKISPLADLPDLGEQPEESKQPNGEK